MPRLQSSYVCQQCGYRSPSYLGKCPECGNWNTLVEEVTQQPSQKRAKTSLKTSEIINISDIEKKDFDRLSSNIEEFDRVLGRGIVLGSIVLVSGDPGIGKCIVGTTRVFDPITGLYLPIIEWKTKRMTVLALDDKGNRLIPQRVIAFHDNGVRPVVQIKTRLGRTLTCTLDHPLLTPIGWKPIKELSVGTRIATPRSLPFFGKKVMPDHEVKLIAYILSDGAAHGAISVTSTIPEVENDLNNIAKKFSVQLRVYDKKGTLAKQFRFVIPRGQRRQARTILIQSLRKAHDRIGIKWQVWARKAEVSYSKLNDWRRGKSTPAEIELERLAKAIGLSINMFAPDARNQAEMVSPIARFLVSIGLKKIKAINKQVPACIFQLPKDQLAIFLKILFSCDGSVYITKGGTAALSYSTISKRLAEDIQHLLLRFGFTVKLRTKYQRINYKLYESYELQMLGIMVNRFLDEIGIWGREEAKAKIKKAMGGVKLPSTHFDTIPIGIEFWEELQQLSEGVSLRIISKNAGVTIRNRRHDRPLTRTTIAALANTIASSYLQTLAFGDIYWDEVESITPNGEERVYDLSIHNLANFIANDLIIHNSTLLSQLSVNIDKTLYIAGEESAHQIKLRVDRIQPNAKLAILNETDVDVIARAIEQVKPPMVIVDSIQTMETTDLESAAGTVSQVREAAHRLQRVAKKLHIPIFLVGHVTKEGTVAGPRTLEHMVDVVLSLEGDPTTNFRVLRASKNRFGTTDEVGIFEMEEKGMVEVKNPSKIFLEGKVNAPGSAVTATLTGLRPMLLEIQALVTKTYAPIPKRVATGIDNNRLQLLVAVLQKRLKLSLFDQDIFVNVTGGLRVVEPAADLAVCVAIISSFKDITIDQSSVFLGEVGLLGELRDVKQLDKRSAEAKKMGFTKVVSPQTAKTLEQVAKGIL